MLRICLCSDNHRNVDSIRKILADNPTCDYYFHCGDSGLNPSEIEPFISVKGNNDWGDDYPNQRVVSIMNHNILIMHGHNYTFSINALASKCKENNCDVLFFGHIHEYLDEEYLGFRMINPGSTYYNRDGSKPCYAIVEIDDYGNIYCKRIDINE